MTILEKIITTKQEEVAYNKSITPIKVLESSIYFETEKVSMREYLLRPDKVGIIAEIKRKSPSTGELKSNVNIEEISIGYMQAGATALSVLTDNTYFGGQNKDLIEARKFNYCPILRKDFIIDEYQILEAKSIGADCILLIAANLTPRRCLELAEFAHKIGLEVLMEAHSKNEIESHCNPHLDIVGVNNRNLHDFTTNIETSMELSEFIPKEFVKISESGITEAEQVLQLKEYGFKGFLVGGHFMKMAEPVVACRELISKIQHQLS